MLKQSGRLLPTGAAENLPLRYDILPREVIEDAVLVPFDPAGLQWVGNNFPIIPVLVIENSRPNVRGNLV